MKQLINLDNNFNEDMFISKVNNIFVMLHTAVMTNNLERVRHYISKEVEEKYEKILNEYNNKNIKVIYGELNVKTTEIEDVSINQEVAIIKVKLVSRYIEYFIDKNTGEYIKGNSNRRIEKNNYLTFKKKITSNYDGIVRKCQSCGASIDINYNGKCNYCKTIFNAEKYDWILDSIEISF